MAGREPVKETGCVYTEMGLGLGTTMTRKYLPTFADLVDRLSIVLLKMIYLPENRETYKAEREMIEHDLDEMMLDINNAADVSVNGESVRAIMMIMLANVTIWRNESEARKGGSSQDHLLRFTHSINGVRNAAKNVLSNAVGERADLKVDCLAADLPSDLGNWNVF